MKATYRIHACKKSTKPGLKFVVRWKDGDGNRRTKYCTTKSEAETFAQQGETELRNQGSEALGFSTSLRVMAQECANRLAERGKTLRDATSHFIAYLDAQERSSLISHAVAEFISAKRNRVKPATVVNLRDSKRHLGKLATALGTKMVSDVTTDDCAAWLTATAFSISNYITLRVKAIEFFTWCQTRRYCTGNPALETEVVEYEEKPVGILKPEELARLLEAADPTSLAFFALGAFAGLRTAEICRLDWSEVDFEDGCIEVPAAKAKTAARRIVKMQPCLRAWLEPLAQPSGLIIPCGPVQIFRRLVRSRLRAGIEEWPKNALRHSFCSYHFAGFKNAAELACEMGHTNTKMIFKHYRAVVRESKALEWWNIMPADADKVLDFALQNGEYAVSQKHRKERDGAGRLKLYTPENGREYAKSKSAYSREYGVSIIIISKWQKIGKPLDDPEHMERLKKGEYQMTARQHAKIYGVPIFRVRVWRNNGWPLDEVPVVRGYLEYLTKCAKDVYGTPAGKAIRVIGIAPRNARHGGSVEISEDNVTVAFPIANLG